MLFVHSAHAWQLVSITHAETGQELGLIYHVYATGTVTKGKEITKVTGGLRLVCSSVTKESPLLVIYWQDMQGSGVHQVVLRNGSREETSAWTQDDNVLYRKISDSKTIMNIISTSSIVQFEWKNEDTVYLITFDMKDFNRQIKTFNDRCGITKK